MHREGINAFELRKDPKKAEKNELITMLETVDRAIKRSTSKSKLSQLKRIKEQLVKKYEDLGEKFIKYEWVKKNYLEGYRQKLKVFFLQENINDKLLKKIKKSRYEKDIEIVKLFDRNVNFLEDEKSSVPIRTTFVEKKMILIDQPYIALMVLFNCYMPMWVT